MKTSSLTKLSIKNAEFYAYHGVKKEEQKLGGKYQVDLDLWYDARNAIVKDDVAHALNYEEAMYCIAEVISSESLRLVETLANEILNMVMERFRLLHKARVRIRKLSVPIKRIVDCIEVEQTMERTASDEN